MARSPDEIDFEQYYENWRHRDTLTWQIPAVAVVIGSGITISSYMAEIPWGVKALAFGLSAFFIATLTVMLAQNLYYQWRDEKHLEDYKERSIIKPQSKPIPSITEEEKSRKSFRKKFGRILGPQRMGSTLLLFTCFSFYVGLSYMFASTWQWCHWFYWVSGISVLVVAFLITFGWFLIWLKRI
ncbi:hypothetical protein ES703_56660 [subsurface metagenome]